MRTQCLSWEGVFQAEIKNMCKGPEQAGNSLAGFEYQEGASVAGVEGGKSQTLEALEMEKSLGAGVII